MGKVCQLGSRVRLALLLPPNGLRGRPPPACPAPETWPQSGCGLVLWAGAWSPGCSRERPRTRRVQSHFWLGWPCPRPCSSRGVAPWWHLRAFPSPDTALGKPSGDRRQCGKGPTAKVTCWLPGRAGQTLATCRKHTGTFGNVCVFTGRVCLGRERQIRFLCGESGPECKGAGWGWPSLKLPLATPSVECLLRVCVGYIRS